MTKPGPYGQTRARRRGTDGGTNTSSIDPRSKVQLATLGQIRRRESIRQELYGESDAERRKKVTLPKFSWDRK